MSIACVGISHHTAPLAVRERAAFGREEVLSLLDAARHSLLPAGVAEVSLVSTCGRTELYAAAEQDVTPLLTGFLREAGRLDTDAAGLYSFTDGAALRHLCRVASGLESIILGEAEVLGQVSAAGALAEQAGVAGPMLEAVFRTAVRAGRRARAETGICRSPLSAASEAVRLVREGHGARGEVLIVGTGGLARLLGEVLRSEGFSRLAIVGRNPARTAAVAAIIDARVRAWSELEQSVTGADVVFTATAAPYPVLTHGLVQSAVAGRAGRDLVLVDLAVPRDIDTAVGNLPGVSLYDLDTLQRRLADNLAARQRDVPLVEAIIEEELDQFESWRHGAELRPVLAAMHHHAEEIRRRELARIRTRLAGRDPEVYRQLEALSRALVAKLLHAPSARLRSEQDPELSRTYVGAVRELFGLELSPPPAAWEDDECP